MGFEKPYIVYVKTNSSGCIIDVNSSAFISDITGWIEIDSGHGDKYHHAQGNYFDDGIRTFDGIFRYLYLGDKKYRLRIGEEMEADRPAPKEPEEDPNIAEIEKLKKRVDDTNNAIAETNKSLNAAVLELNAEKKKTAALAEELEAAKILLGVE